MKPFEPQPLPIGEVDWEPLIPILGKANRALSHYDGVLEGMPNPSVLLAPFITQEAVLSSQIEGTQATLGEVYQYEAGEMPREESRRQDIHEILNYRRALRDAENELKTRPFNLNLLKRLHAVLLDSVRGEDKGRGTFRQTQNWIGAPGSTAEQAVFVPPTPASLPALLDNWEKYYHLDRPDPLVQLGVLHAQFEILHPFLDGNGRLGRIIIPLFLFEKRVLHQPVFYMSGWLEAHKDEYMSRLRPLGVEAGSWNGWLAFFLGGVAEQAIANSEKARKVIELYRNLGKRMARIMNSSHAVSLLDQMFGQPIFDSARIGFGERAPSKESLARWLRKLREDGIITVIDEGSGRRPTKYVLAELINICEGKKLF